jgi:hypothetical protein
MRAYFLGGNVAALGNGIAKLQMPPLAMEAKTPRSKKNAVSGNGKSKTSKKSKAS